MQSRQKNNAEDRILLSVAHYDEVVRYNSTNSVNTIMEDMGLKKFAMVHFWPMPVDLTKLFGISKTSCLWLFHNSGEITKLHEPWLYAGMLAKIDLTQRTFRGWAIVDDTEPRYYVTEHGQGRNKHYAVRDGEQHRVVATHIVDEKYANHLRDYCEQHPHNFEEEE
jgi:hypothetical protein